MIKIIAFDLIGVLVGEKHIELKPDEEKLERLFGPNKSDEEFIQIGLKTIGQNKPILKIAKNTIFKLYRVRQKKVLEELKKINPQIKIIIATNHISLVKEFIENVFDKNMLDDIIISADIGIVKPNLGFYKYILKKHKIKPEELLFLDDNKDNVESASKLGINTIKVDREMDLLEEITKFLRISQE